MANDYFQFKQFTVYQQHCAMKVTTDGCLFGAWVAAQQTNTTENVLDIGAGTGLLSLMYAQQHSTANIHAIEIDRNAFEQATANFSASPWKQNLQAIFGDIKYFEPSHLYDTIISNPPFYEKQLTATKAAKNMAHHDTGLLLPDLFSHATRLLKPAGIFYVLLPYYREAEAIQNALTKGFNCTKITRAKQTPTHTFFRTMVAFKKGLTDQDIIEDTTIIKDSSQLYTAEFTSLLKDYYLAF